MGFFSSLFGSNKTESKPQKTLSLEELIRSCTEDGVLYKVIPFNSMNEYNEVFFFDADDKKVRFREMAADGIKSLTFDKLVKCHIDVDGALISEEKEGIFKEISNRETDVIIRFWFYNEKGLVQDWGNGYLVRDDGESLKVKKSHKAKKVYIVRKNLIGEIEFAEKGDIE